MPKRKLQFDKIPPKRLALAKQFLQLQKKVPKDREELEKLSRNFSKKNGQPMFRSDELLAALETYPPENKEKWKLLCRKRSVRSESGVSVVAILTRAYGCPGKCIYCPAPAQMPKSYLPNEPAVLRAISARFSPVRQVKNRIRALKATGHDPSKIELIIMGGTWSALPARYQTQYIRSCYFALNDRKGPMRSLNQEQKDNESAPHRCVGLTLETRPDWITEKEIKKMRRFGCTRVEIGVQTLNDDIQKLTKRGHGKKEVIKATRLLRDAGFKVVYHMMLNLPGSDPSQDIAQFKELFSNSDYCPDQVKIYPCVLTKDAELIKWYENKKWIPYSDVQLADTIIKIKKYIPEYCRVIRVIRDIPSDDIIAGSKISNLRQILQNKGMVCRCIRCREIRDRKVKQYKLVKREFSASDGKEIFLSYEDPEQDALIALLRLRFPSPAKPIFPVLKDAALVRELHVYGLQTPVGLRGSSAQHFGLGKKLLDEAENISTEKGFRKIAVIAGVGVRNYYRKLGYKLKEGYMVKFLNQPKDGNKNTKERRYAKNR